MRLLDRIIGFLVLTVLGSFILSGTFWIVIKTITSLA